MINYNIAISKEKSNMASFLDELLKKMKTAPHVGIPPVTNPKVPTKVERDTAEYAARQKEMPNFKFGTGTPLERLKSRMGSTPHPTPTFADPAFNNKTTPRVLDEAVFDAEFQAYLSALRSKKKHNETIE